MTEEEEESCWPHPRDSSVLALSCSMIATPRKLSLGCSKLDGALGGGVDYARGSVAEVAGEAGVGKTQMLLGMLVTAQLGVDQGGLAG